MIVLFKNKRFRYKQKPKEEKATPEFGRRGKEDSGNDSE